MKRGIIIPTCCCVALLLLMSSGFPQGPAQPRAQAPRVPLTLDHGGKIVADYDGFKQEIVVTLKKMRVTCGNAKGLQSTLKDTCVSVVAALHCPGKQLDHVRLARLQLIFESKNWDRRHSLEERELLVVADGERFNLGRMSLAQTGMDSDRLLAVMKEVLEVSLPFKTFRRIALAERVEVSVGRTQFELSEKNIAALRDVNNRVQP